MDISSKDFFPLRSTSKLSALDEVDLSFVVHRASVSLRCPPCPANLMVAQLAAHSSWGFTKPLEEREALTTFLSASLLFASVQIFKAHYIIFT